MNSFRYNGIQSADLLSIRIYTREKRQGGIHSQRIPLGLKGIVIGEGDTYEEALADVKSAIQFHIETFGPDVLMRIFP